MGITVLIALENHSRQAVQVLNIENASTAGSGVSVAPGSAISTNMYIPWASSDGDFNGHRLELRYDGTPRFWVWQDGDFVRFSTDGHWHAGGSPVPGFARVGFALGAPSPDATRSIIVQDDCFEVVDFNGLPITAAFQELIGTVGYRMCDVQPAEPAPMSTMASVPKSTSVAFSVAGISSDAFESGKPGARFLFGDSGKRYAFEIRNGVVFAKSRGLPDVALTTTVSYNHKRKRLAETTTMPPVDLIASNGGRVFAKAKDRNSFYFTTMDDMFVGGDDSGEFIAPSTYFKVDPEFNRAGASSEDLVGHLAGRFRGYPAVERFPLFRFLIQQPIVDFMIVRLERRTWHLLDVRPPLASLDGSTIAISILQHALLPMSGVYDLVKGVIGPLSTWIDGMFNVAKQHTEQTASPPPSWLSTYRHVDYCSGPNTMSLQSIEYYKVLDIGVGAVHWHEQYESLTGGELQPLRSGPVVSNFTYLQLYQLLNGPIRDADGYIDGTCNYYALVRLKTDDTDRHDAYGVLYVDEQSYFTQRWRLVHPADFHGLRGVATDIDSNANRYGWNAATFWCPSRDGRLTARSRLAVSRQVLVVSGEEPDGTALLYSINFSYSTMDRTWRWRPLPPAATVAYFANDPEAGAETIAPTPNSVYPQTLRLREDMTLHLKGMQGNTLGRWYQRYLPASNELVPHAGQLVSGTRPATGYTHPWKFAAEDVFQAADQFSHLGVYDTVDSRTQYYTVEPVAGDPAEDVWADDGDQISLGAVKFWWPAPLHPELDVRRPPSIFNPVTRLRLAKRGSRWIAMHADKRDDELMPFDLPVQVDLTSAGRRITVKLTANTWVERPPAVRTVYFWREGAVAALAFTTPIGAENAVFDNVARVRIAALAQGAVVTLLDLRTEGSVGFNDGYWEYRWTPSAADAALLARYCTVDGAASSGTSIWFEDIVGHVATSESAVVWNWPPVVKLTVAPAQIPLGIPVAVSIHAVNKYDGTVLHGNFTVDDGASGTSDVVLMHTFNGHVETSAPDPNLGPGSGPRVGHGPPPRAPGDLVTPIGTMRVAGYPDADIPFNFSMPRLDVGIDTTAFVVGQSGQFKVTARDTTTKAAVPAQVFVGITNVGAANGAQPLVHVFSAGDTMGSVTAQGYPSFLLAFHLSVPPPPATLVVNVDPSTFPIGRTVQVTVHAQNSVTRAPVNGSVAINGTVVGSTNVPFAYTAPKKAPGPRLNKLQPVDVVDTTSTTITVSAPGFAAVTVEI